MASKTVHARHRWHNLVGQQFNHWTVTSGELPHHREYVMARCVCGHEREVRLYSLTGNKSISCGCLTLGSTRTLHGMWQGPTYRNWRSMLARCHDPANKKWYLYGGRGITVCERWRVFTSFLADMGERPADRPTIDRIDPTGNYEPGNCRWASYKEQSANQRRTLTEGFCRGCGAAFQRLAFRRPLYCTEKCRRRAEHQRLGCKKQ